MQFYGKYIILWSDVAVDFFKSTRTSQVKPTSVSAAAYPTPHRRLNFQVDLKKMID
jgi:hypothetical protein